VDLIMCDHSVDDILYQDVFDRLLERYPSFRLVHCISDGIGAEHSYQNGRVEWHHGRLTKEVVCIANTSTRCMVSGPAGLCRVAADIWKSLGQQEQSLYILDDMESNSAHAIVEVLDSDSELSESVEVQKEAKKPAKAEAKMAKRVLKEAKKEAKKAPKSVGQQENRLCMLDELVPSDIENNIVAAKYREGSDGSKDEAERKARAEAKMVKNILKKAWKEAKKEAKRTQKETWIA